MSVRASALRPPAAPVPPVPPPVVPPPVTWPPPAALPLLKLWPKAATRASPSVGSMATTCLALSVAAPTVVMAGAR